MQLARRVIGHVLDFCYPARCAACGTSCPSAMLCSTCEELQQKLEQHPACDLCAKPLTEWLAPCPYCNGKGIHPFDQIAALGGFDDPLKKLIHPMKYNRRWPLAEQLAERLANLDRVREILNSADTL